MHEKIVEEMKEREAAALGGGRRVAVPGGMSAAELAALEPEEVKARLVALGRPVAIAALVRLAAGVADTPAAVQRAAARDLLEQADKIEAGGGDDPAGLLAQFRGLTPGALRAIIAQVELIPAAPALPAPAAEKQPEGGGGGEF